MARRARAKTTATQMFKIAVKKIWVVNKAGRKGVREEEQKSDQ